MRKKPRTNSFMSAREDEVTLTQSQPRPQIVVGEGGQWAPQAATDVQPTEITSRRRRNEGDARSPRASTQRSGAQSIEITAGRVGGDARSSRASTQRSGAQSIEVTVRRGRSEGGQWVPAASKRRSEATTVEITVPGGHPVRSGPRGRSRRGAV